MRPFGCGRILNTTNCFNEKHIKGMTYNHIKSLKYNNVKKEMKTV